MHLPARHSLAVGLFVLTIGIASASAAEWRRIDSPNFVVVGDVPVRTLRDVAMEFEGFREALTAALTDRAPSAPVPTIVIVFPSEKVFTPFKPPVQGKPVSNSGMFVGRQDANYIAFVADGNSDVRRAVFHEYAHVVVSDVLRNVPMWLNEGLAEYFSVYELGKNGHDAVLGRSVSNHIRRLQNTQPLKLDELFNVDRNSPLYSEKDRRSVFYAQAWALTHRILHAQPRLTKELASYLNRTSEGVAPLAAWQQIFGPANLDRELESYIRQQSIPTVTYTLSEKLAKFEAVDAPLSVADADAFLAEFLLQMRRYDDAAARLSVAQTLEPDNVRLKTVAALLDLARGEHKKANEQLLSMASPADWLIAYSAATALAEIVAHRSEPPESDQIEAARRLFGIVRQQRGEMANSMVRFAEMEVKSAEGPTKETRTAMERARLMAAGREDYVLVHAQVLARLSEFASARTILGPLLSPAYPQEVRENARNLMGYILKLESENQVRSQASPQSISEQLPTLGAAEPTSPDPASPPAGQSGILYRALRFGEQRLQGALERIECVAKGGAIFHVRTEDGITRVTGRMSEVDFITYRDDLSASIGCGPLKPPAPIYLTWRTDPAKPTDKVAVAIEFLPK